MRSRVLLALSAAAMMAVPLQAQWSPRLLDTFQPRAIGPAYMSGRTVSLAVYEEDPAIFYAATASGGLLKTENGGTSWTNVFERQGTVSIGAVAIQQNDPNVVWVGTGEANNRQSSSWGDGVYKSTDGGATWQHMGLRDTHHIGAIVINPTNPNVVYVAALGRLWGPNPERGVFMTTDGGRTWQHVLRINNDTGAVDLVMDPTDPNTLITAAYQRRRSSWGFSGGGPHGGIHKSTDGGRTWRRVTQGLPSGDIGRIGLDIYRSNPNILYATVEAQAEMGGVFRSEDKGESWTQMNTYNPRPMYFSKVRIDPNNDQRIYVLGVRLAASNDGFRTYEEEIAPQVHLDHHAMWINPRNSRHIIDANDGGTWVSRDMGLNWEHLNNYPAAQFYSVAVDMQEPYHVYGGLQDNASWGGPSAVRSSQGIANEHWYQMLSCDGEAVAVDPFQQNLIYTNCQNGRIVRYDRLTGERKQIQPQPNEGEPALRWNWTTPIVTSIHKPGTIYTAANRVFRSTDRGHSWTPISGDLTMQIDRDTLMLMGVRGADITLARNDGMSSFGNVTALAESPRDGALMYAGTDDGRVHVTRDGGRTWADLTPRIRGVPAMLQVSRVTPSAARDGTVYVTFDGHRSNDMRPYAFASDDFGATWRSISGGLPEGSVYVLKEDEKNPNLLYLGTEFALFVSLDRGGNWTRWGNFPTVAVYDLVIHPRDNDLVLGTHGRSFMVYDDISPLQQMTPAVLASNAHLFQLSRPATQFIPNEDGWFIGGRSFRAPNPEFGAYINYYLRTPARDVRFTITDAFGRVVRVLEGPGEPGLHRIAWDLRTEPFGPITAGLAGQNNIGQLGAFVIPGDYRIRMAVGGQEQITTVQVMGDPLVTIADSDRRQLHDMVVTLTEAQRSIASAMQRVEGITDTARRTELERLGGGVRQRVNSLKGELIGSQSAPTANQADRFGRVQPEIADFVRRVDQADGDDDRNELADAA